MAHRSVLTLCCPELLKSIETSPEDSGITQAVVDHDNPTVIVNLLQLCCPSSETVAPLCPGNMALVAEAAHHLKCIKRIEDRLFISFIEAAHLYDKAKSAPMQDVWDLTLTAYWLGSVFWFERFTLLMASGKPKSYLKMAMQTKDKELGLKLSRKQEQLHCDSISILLT